MNIVVLRGVLSSTPVDRALASGTLLRSLELSTATTDGTWSVPVAWFDPPVGAGSFDAGDEVVVVGAVRRRFFRGAAGTQSRTEVVASEVLPASHTKRVKRVIEREAERLGDAGGRALRSV